VTAAGEPDMSSVATCLGRAPEAATSTVQKKAPSQRRYACPPPAAFVLGHSAQSRGGPTMNMAEQNWNYRPRAPAL